MTIPGIYSQRDPRWCNQELGWNTDPYYNLYHFGCAVVGVTNIVRWVSGDESWTPDKVNEWLHNHDAFTDGAQTNQGGLIIWGALATFMSHFDIEYHGFTTNLSDTNNFLAPENNFALAQLRGPGFPMHFSAMPYVGQIADSWDAQLKPVTTYTFVGAHLYTKKSPVAVVVPPTQTVPVQASVPAPLPQSAPAPAPSNPVPQPDPNPAPVLPTAPMEQAGPLDEPMALPEWDESFRWCNVDGFVEPQTAHDTQDEAGLWHKPGQIWLTEDTYAVDVTGQGPNLTIKQEASPYWVSGFFYTDDKKYWRGTKAYQNGEVYGIPDAAVSKPEVPEVKPRPSKWSTFWDQFKRNPLGALIRLATRRA